MAGIQFIAGLRAKLTIEVLKRGMPDLHRRAALTADQMMVMLFGQLIDDPSSAHVCRKQDAFSREVFQGPVDRRLGQPWEFFARLFVHLHRRKMPMRVMQHMQDGIALRCDAQSTGAKAGGKTFSTGHFLLLQEVAIIYHEYPARRILTEILLPYIP